MIKSLQPIIEAHPFFRGIAPEHLELITGCARNLRYRPGEHLMREGAAADTFYLIREGRVLLQINGGARGLLTVQTAGPGEVVGWSWLVPPYECRFDAQAVETTRAIAFEGRCLRGKCEANPAMGYELLKRVSATLAQRLATTRAQLLDVYGSPRAAAGERDDEDERDGDLYGNFF